MKWAKSRKRYSSRRPASLRGRPLPGWDRASASRVDGAIDPSRCRCSSTFGKASMNVVSPSTLGSRTSSGTLQLLRQPDRAGPGALQLGCDRPHRPVVADRLHDQPAAAAAADPLGAALLDGELLHRHAGKVAVPGELEVAAAVLGEAAAVELPDDAPRRRRAEEAA